MILPEFVVEPLVEGTQFRLGVMSTITYRARPCGCYLFASRFERWELPITLACLAGATLRSSPSVNLESYLGT